MVDECLKIHDCLSFLPWSLLTRFVALFGLRPKAENPISFPINHCHGSNTQVEKQKRFDLIDDKII